MTTKQEDQMIVKMSLKDFFHTATSISHAFCEQTGKPISRKTVSRWLNKEKLVAWIPCRKPLILKKNQKVRLDFTTDHIVWTEEQWNMVYLSDESKFNLFGSDDKRFVRHKNREHLSPQCVKKTVKFGGGSIMVWGMVSSAGVGPIVHFHNNINVSVYKELLHQHALPHLHKGTVEIPIFMQDNTPCQKAKSVLSFLEEEGIAVIKRPPQSPDTNPIENVGKMIGEKDQNRNPQNMDDLWGFLKEEWESITTTFCKKFISSCDRRCNEVIKCQRKFTKY